MPEWWTYAPGDFLMYAPRVYDRLVDAYQREIWPAQLAALALAVAVAALARSRVAWRGRAAAATLAAGWAWIAWAFLAQRYPRLAGDVLEGTATEHSAVELHLFADAAGTCVGAALGTSTVTSRISSSHPNVRGCRLNSCPVANGTESSWHACLRNRPT